MILIDWKPVVIAHAIVQGTHEDATALIRHGVLNSIRSHRKKYHAKYGEVVVATEGSNNWRYGTFPQYKGQRAGVQEESKVDWDFIKELVDQLSQELRDNFPYKVVTVDECEADDVIAQLVESTQEFGCNEPVMIISGDKDFSQLQRYSNVQQFAPIQRKAIIEKKPHDFLAEHILRGDRSDGIPNVLSPDNTFVDGMRQTPLRNEVLLNLMKDPKCMGEEVYRNYLRNKTLVDLRECPEDIKTKIMETYEGIDTSRNKGKILNYLIKHRCRALMECAGDFTG